MTISINTSEYTKTKEIVIDGTTLHIRPMSSAETLKLSNFGSQLKEFQVEGNQKEVLVLFDELSKMYFGLFDKPEVAKKLLSPLSYEAWFEIYGKVFGVEKNA